VANYSIICWFNFISRKSLAIAGGSSLPIGAVVFTEFWILPKLSILQYRAEKYNLLINYPALLTWGLSLVIVFLIPIHLFFKWLPGYFISIALYIAFAYLDESRRKKRGISLKKVA
jgi:hypothetical protein